MRHPTILLCLLPMLLLHNVYGQSITRYEYFIDADPGLGKAISFTVGAADSISISETVNTTGLSAELHIIGIRAMYSSGVWGFPEFRHLLILPLEFSSPDNILVKAEYFFNTDPGIGNAIGVTFSAADSITTNIALDITGLSVGLHTVGIRFKGQHGKWGQPEFRKLLIQPIPGVASRQIVAGEFYYGDTIPGVGSGIPFTVSNVGDSVSVEIADTLNNLAIGQHKIHIRFKNANGAWSHQESRPFTVCSDYGPVSNLIYGVEGNKVFFTNESANADFLLWKFGDNTTDTVLNPVKTYTTVGIKNVQLITKNNCGADTLLTPVEIRGLQKVNPGRAGNTGISTLLFEGFGFTAATNVKLVLGAQSFTPVRQSLLNSNRIQAYFDLTGFIPGEYRAVATLGGSFDTLQQALTIENNVPVLLSLQNSGRPIFRTGKGQLISTIQNRGSHDAIMVPYIGMLNIKEGESANTNFFTTTDMMFLQDKGIFQHTLQYLAAHNVVQEVMDENMLDSARGRHLVAYYKVKIPGYSSTTEIARNRNTTPYGYQAGSMVMPEMLDSYASLGVIHSDFRACYNTFLKHEIEKQLKINIPQAGWDNCFNNAFDTLMKTFASIAQNPAFEKFGVPMQAGFSALLASVADCSGSGIPAGLGGTPFKRIVQGVMENWIFREDVDSLHADCIDTTEQFTDARIAGTMHPDISGQTVKTLGDCGDCPGAKVFPELCESCGPILKAVKKGKKIKGLKKAFGSNSAVQGCLEWCENSSIDPNAKYGPGNNNDRIYINHTGDIAYTIAFENIASATAPAAFVEIRDTIDKSLFDISTLQLGIVSWGDSSITVEPNKQSHSLLKDIRPTHPNYLRVDVVTDTATGEMRWRFWTLDTATLQLTDEVAEGFLPPNTNGISGAGYVTFTIRPLSTVTNGTILKNKATIVFDNNAPISTAVWEYRMDTLKPVSQVNSLPAVTNATGFNVQWSGNDQHAGIDRYSVYVSVNDSAYKLWQSLTAGTLGNFTGQFGKTYKFISIALDKAGNFEDPPLNALTKPDAVTTLQSPLSLTLLEFEAKARTREKKADMSWTTTYEFEVSHFEIQRSADGLHFQNIGRVEAKNIPAVSHYSWTDEQPLSGLIYYRLKIVNKNGVIEYSAIRWVSFDGQQKSLLVFPAVTDGWVFIQSDHNLVMEVLTIQGKKLMNIQVRGNDRINLSGLPAGLYLLHSTKDNQVFRIIKR